MSLELIKENGSIDFSYFNEKNSIFNKIDIKDEKWNNDNIDDDLNLETHSINNSFDSKNYSDEEKESISTSFDSKNNKKNYEEELKLFPFNLLNIMENDFEFDLYEKEKRNKNIDKLDLNSKPFIPKYMVFNCNNKKVLNIHINKNNIDKNKKNKKKKKKFCEKKGDWTCYLCKNLNFSFRDVCNRCKLSKIESDKKYEKAFNDLEKLYNINKKNS